MNYFLFTNNLIRELCCPFDYTEAHIHVCNHFGIQNISNEYVTFRDADTEVVVGGQRRRLRLVSDGGSGDRIGNGYCSIAVLVGDSGLDSTENVAVKCSQAWRMWRILLLHIISP